MHIQIYTPDGKPQPWLDGFAQALTQRLGKPRSPRSTAAGVHGFHLTVALERRRQERDRALETGSDFFSAGRDHRIELWRAVIASDESFGVGGRKAVLALKISVPPAAVLLTLSEYSVAPVPVVH